MSNATRNNLSYCITTSIRDNLYFIKCVEDIYVYIAFKKDHVTIKKNVSLPIPIRTVAVIKLENNETL